MTVDAIGGVWTHALELARGLGPYGVQVTFALLGGGMSARQRAAAEALANVQLAAGQFRLEWMDDPWDDVAATGEWLSELEAALRPDVMHFNGYALAAAQWRAPTLVVAHSCVCSWFAAVRGTPPPGCYDRYRADVTRGLAAAGAVTAPTAAMLRQLRRHYRVSFRALECIHNGCDASRFAPGAKEAFVLTAGRLWDEAKNVADLDRAAGQLDRPVYAAGAARAPHGTEPAFKHLRLLGALAPEELAQWYGRAAIFATPALYEPFGLAALEAGLSGCALVLGDIESLREVWGDAALFVPPQDHEQLAGVLAHLAGNSGECRAWGERARVRAREFTAERMARDYYAAYQRLLSGSVATTRPAPAADLAAPAAPERE